MLEHHFSWQEYNKKTDVWSLGLVFIALWRLCCSANGNYRENVEKLRNLIENKMVNVKLANQRDKDKRAGLHLAVDNGRIEMVEILVQSGAELDQKESKGWTYAAAHGHMKIDIE